MAYLVYMWHGELKIKEGYQRLGTCFQADDGWHHTKCPATPMTLHRGKILVENDEDLPIAIEMVLSRKEEWLEKYWNELPCEKEEEMATKRKEPETIELLSKVGELYFEPGEENLNLIRLLVDSGYLLRKCIYKPRKWSTAPSYTGNDAPKQINYIIYEKEIQEV